MIRKHSINVRAGLLVSGTILVLVIGILFGFSWSMLEVRAGSDLPPRNPPPGAASTPTGQEKDDDEGDQSRVGAHIELWVRPQPNAVGLWSVVQWQDDTDHWHDVDNWQGTLGSGGNKRWWVAQKDFKSGPFRWVVRQGPGGPVVGSSEPFLLPGAGNEVLQVTVSLE